MWEYLTKSLTNWFNKVGVLNVKRCKSNRTYELFTNLSKF